MNELILKLLKEYIEKNHLIVKIDYIRNPDWYKIELCLSDNEWIWKDKLIVEEYKSSTVIYVGDKRFDFINEKFEIEFKKNLFNFFR